MFELSPLVAPTDAESTQAAAVLALADTLMTTIGVAQVLVTAEREVDLTGLDSQIGLLCAKTLDLPSADWRRLRPKLIDLLGAADALSWALAKRAPPSR